MIITVPLRRMILHFSQMGFTDGRTFTGFPPPVPCVGCNDCLRPQALLAALSMVGGRPMIASAHRGGRRRSPHRLRLAIAADGFSACDK